ncbi:MAG: D-alanyl-D-alanine carboxypeptidase/D-alanyl-D-alanine-endopeptidase [Deltaproteobacteria bacterium]|nr:D-alanyl-D-alanine carboxypeptidase/D-alanyl-D-alanine-endopeptidase [Deltaproteobacteria bacterium]
MRRLLFPWLLTAAFLVTSSAIAAPKTVATAKSALKTAATTTTRAAAKKPVKERPAPRLVTTAATLKPALKTAVTLALNEEALDNVDVGFIATDLKTGAVLAESGADALINPASNAKMITSAAALHVLHPEYRFKTDYYVQGSLRDGTLHGNLVVKGYGDPTIVSERVTKIANELYLFGIERITGGIVVDESWFDPNEEARGWELEESPDRAYAAPVNALMVNYNAIAVYVRPGSTPGMPAVVRVDPPSERVRVSGEVLTEAVGSGVRLVSQKDDDVEGLPSQGTLLTIQGSVGVREPPARIYRRVYDPARHFGSVLTAFLQQRGVKMRHSVVKGPVPAGARLILVDKSRPLKEIVDDLNHYSNNIIAETLIKAMAAETMGAPGTFDNGLVVAREFLEQRVGFAPGSYVFGNGSGLNDVNRFTARQLAQLVRFVAADYEIATEWFTSLAVAGTQGTINHRMRDTPAQRRLRAKTGTLSGVSALSGTVVQPDGNVIAFSILAQGYKSGAGAIWKVQNLLGAAFASDGTWNLEKEDADEPELVSVTGTAAAVEVSAGGG